MIAVALRLGRGANFSLIHHSNGSWNPGKLLILTKLLDSSFRWNDEITAKFTIFGQTGRQKTGILFTISILLSILFATNLFAIGSTGMYATQLKFEYQFSDYNQYVYPVVERDDSIRFEYVDPYIVNFPEHRSLAKITQAFGPLSNLEIRYEYSALTDDKQQDRYYFRINRDVTDLTGMYGVYQALTTAYDSPDSASSNSYLVAGGIKHDRSGWIKSELSFSYDHYRAPDGLLIESFLPMASVRWSINSFTALSGRWDGYWTVSDTVTTPAHAVTVFLSRYLPTQTAVHLVSRFYTNDAGIKSISPAVEIAQYILWNLTARVNYRYYRNRFDDEAIPLYITGRAVKSHSLRTYIQWQIGADLKLNFKLRRYWSTQDIKMNTYLFGVEYEI